MKIKLYSGGYPPVFLGWVEPETLADGFIDVTKDWAVHDLNGRAPRLCRLYLTI